MITFVSNENANDQKEWNKTQWTDVHLINRMQGKEKTLPAQVHPRPPPTSPKFAKPDLPTQRRTGAGTWRRKSGPCTCAGEDTPVRRACVRAFSRIRTWQRACPFACVRELPYAILGVGASVRVSVNPWIQLTCIRVKSGNILGVLKTTTES